MSGPKIGKCANPDCDAKFRRLGDGKLYVRPSHSPENRNVDRVLKAIWICDRCSPRFNVRFNESSQSFDLVPSNSAAA